MKLPNSKASDKKWRKYLAYEFANLLKRSFRLEKGVEGAMKELGVPQSDYPAPVANAYRILQEALNDFNPGRRVPE